MADYYPLVARAVAGLEKNTGEARRALYERARTSLVAQLRGVTPALSESEITRERLALEESIRKIEGESARQSRLGVPRPDLAPQPPRPAAAPPMTPEPKPSGPGSSPPRGWTEMPLFEPAPSEKPAPEPARPPTPPPEPIAPASAKPEMTPPPAKPETPPPSAPVPPLSVLRAEPIMPGRRTGAPAFADMASLIEQGRKGFRPSPAERAAEAGDARPAPPAPEPAPSPPPSPEAEDVEPLFEAEDREPAGREMPAAKPAEADLAADEPPGDAPAPIPEDFEPPPPRRSPRETARTILIVFLLIALGVAAAFTYRERDRVMAFVQSWRGPTTPVARDPTQARPKISDRIGPAAPQDSAAAPGSPPAAVAQRVVLYEQQPNSTERKQYIGSVIWRTETAPPGPGQAADLAVKADVEIPERHLRLSFTMRRNLEQTLPASHTIEIIFNTAADFPPGGIADVPGVLMEQAEQTRGVPLTGLRVKVTNGFFLIGLSAVETEAKRNIQLLKERPWVDIPLVYNDGNRALLAIEKGVPGDRVFADAFAAWGQ
jgi:hypothetical protein